MDSKAWLITGCSTGFGRELARFLLAHGQRVAVTARDKGKIEDLTAGQGKNALALTLDVTRAEQIAAAVQATEAAFGGIDVLVNNAGFGYFGSFEESDLAEARRMFETNVWGLAEMTRAALPGMRRRHSGVIVNFSSIAGLVGFPALSFYNATKFAVEGLSESLAVEAAPFGIKVIIVEPGPFRTDWAGRSANEAAAEIPEYAATAGARQAMLRGMSGRQPGDPVRAAAAILKAVESPEPPLHLLLGKPALDGALKKLDALRKDFETWAEVTKGADYPPEA